MKSRKRLPEWFRMRFPKDDAGSAVSSVLDKYRLSTICQEGSCPNISECWEKRHATFLILGKVCTRNCLYCDVSHGKPIFPDPNEPERIAKAVMELSLRHVIITSVTRDDLQDRGAETFIRCMQKIREIAPESRIELLVPEFNGPWLRKIIKEGPDILAHNIEAAGGAFRKVRPGSDYERSIGLLKDIKKIDPDQETKSGFMVGLGESWEDILSTMQDLRSSGIDYINIGQYLQPSMKNIGVEKYYHPDEFRKLKKHAESLGFSHIECGPLVRSSYYSD
jgi:lipoic acid synthetase